MSTVPTAHSAAAWFRGFAGLVAGSLVNIAGVAAALAGAGLWVYWTLMLVAVMVGVAASRSRGSRWFGVGLTIGCVAEFVVLLAVVLSAGHLGT